MLKNKYILCSLFYFSWIISILLGIFYISPNSDDIFYALPALGFANFGTLGVPYFNNEPWEILFNFPTYSFLQGILFFIIDFVGLEITFISYRISQSIITMTFIIVSSMYILKDSKVNTFNYFLPSMLFVSLLGLIPFSMSWIIFRPEIAGLLFFISGFWFLVSALNKKNNIIQIILGSLFIGITITLHPLFSIISFFSIFTFAIQFLIKRTITKLLLLIIFSALPICILLLYILVFSNDYYEVIKGQIPLTTNGPRAIFGLINLLVDFNFHWTVKTLHIYYFIYFLIIIFGIIILITKIKNYFNLNHVNDKNSINILVLIFSCILTLFVSFHLIYIHSTISALLLFSVIVLFKEKINIISKNFSTLFKIFLFMILIFLPLSWSIINLAKHTLREDYYLSSKDLINKLNLSSDNRLNTFVISHQLAPLVIDKLGKPNINNTYWLFPSVGQVHRSLYESNRIKEILNNKVENQSAFWLLRSKDDQQGYSVLNDGAFCIDIPMGAQEKNSRHIKIKVLEPTIIYQSFKFTVVKGGKSYKGC